MPFEFQPYRNPYAGTIGDLMGAPAAARARALRASATAEANATLASGQAWAGAAQNIGQIIGAIPQQIQQQKTAQQEQQVRDLQLKQATRADENATIVEHTKKAMAGLMNDPSVLNDDGTFNLKGISDKLSQMPSGSSGPVQPIDLKTLADTIDPINKSILEAKENGLKYQQMKANAMAGLAAGALRLGKADGNYFSHAASALAAAQKSGLLTEQEATQTLTQLVEHRENIPQVLEDFVARSNVPNVKLAPGDTLVSGVDPTQVLANGAAKPKTQAELAADASNPSSPTAKQSAAALQLLKAPKEPNAQAKEFELDHKLVMGAFVPDAKGGRYFYNGEDVTGDRVKPVPPASVQVMNAAGNVKPEDDPVAKAIADYRVPPPSPRSMTSPEGEALMRRVSVLNPDYDASQFPTRQKMRQAFTSGAQGQAINSLNTAIIHLDQFVDVAKALDNGNFRPGNEFFNRIKATFGDSAPTNFDGLKTIMSGELASAFKKSGATDTEIHDVKSAISSSNSTKQLVDYVTKIAIPALGGKTATYTEQYRQVMGENDPFKILLPDAVKVLTKYGLDPDHPSMGSDGKKTPVALTPGLQRVMERP
jgi:hypothetical protein